MPRDREELERHARAYGNGRAGWVPLERPRKLFPWGGPVVIGVSRDCPPAVRKQWLRTNPNER